MTDLQMLIALLDRKLGGEDWRKRLRREKPKCAKRGCWRDPEPGVLVCTIHGAMQRRVKARWSARRKLARAKHPCESRAKCRGDEATVFLGARRYCNPCASAMLVTP